MTSSATLPTNLKYTEEHEWIKIEGNIVTIGITDHAQNLLTDIVFVELPQTGTTVQKGGALGVVESVKSVSDVYSPVDGEITAVNAELEANPGLINSAAQSDGWIAKITLSDESQIQGLMDDASYQEFCKGSQ